MFFTSAHQARARLRERHRENLRKKLEMLKAEQGVIEETENAESFGREQESPSSSSESEASNYK